MDPKDIKLAGIVFQDDQFMNTMVKGYKAAADKYGVSIVTANTNNDQSKETELIQTYMAQGHFGVGDFADQRSGLDPEPARGEQEGHGDRSSEHRPE